MEHVSIDSFVEGLPDKYLACRRLGHPWRHYTVRRDGPGFVETLRCPSCLTRRIDTLDSRGHLVSRSYAHAEGYLAEHVEGGLRGSRDVFRLEAITRLVDKLPPESNDVVPIQGRRKSKKKVS